MRGTAQPVYHAIGEVPVGEIDGQKMEFSLAHEPIEKSLEITLEFEGEQMPLIKGIYYDVAGKQLVLKFPPKLGSKLMADYLWSTGSTGLDTK